ncbi:MAG: hypothetical protein H6824_10395 [Planctomycetaceae bacterium]|nr:hypothetical protein [Planctomycetaceae bacterium]
MAVVVFIVSFIVFAFALSWLNSGHELVVSLSFAAVAAYDLYGRLSVAGEMEALLSPEAGLSIRNMPGWLLSVAMSVIFVCFYFRLV